MNGILKVTKYQLRDYRKSVGIYYSIILILAVAWIIAMLNTNATGYSNFSGSTVIFIFILGLNTFKNSFKFTHANNVSRKRFYYGTMIAIVIVSLFMAFADTILTSIFLQSGYYKSNFHQIYNYVSFVDDFFWSFGVLLFATSIGWFITMLYYRANNIMKIIISIMPVVFIIIFSYINSLLNGKILSSLISFLGNILGITGEVNPYNAVLSFIIGTIGLFALNYLLIRRAPIKD